MPNISDSLMRKKFVEYLERCESSNMPDEWEARFVRDMRDKFEDRERMSDLGMTPWNPSVNQWNTLKLIAEKCR